MRIIGIFFILAFFISNLLAATYWISTEGKSIATGSELDPFSSIQAALDQIGGSHTFIVKSGYYSGQIAFSAKHCGTPDRPTVIRSQYKYASVLNGSPGYLISIAKGCQWIVVDGFDVSGAMLAGVHCEGDYVVIRNCWIHNNAGQGIGSFGGDNIVIEANLIEFNGLHPQFHHGIYLHGNKNIIVRNIVRFNSGVGLHLYPEISNSRIENNLVHNNHKSGILVFSKLGTGRNTVVNNTVAFNGEGIVISKANNDSIVNNIVVYNERAVNKTPPISPYLPEADTLEKAYVDYNFCIPPLKTAGKNNQTGEADFVDIFRYVFFLTKKSKAIGTVNLDYMPPTDFFDRKRNPLQASMGCFSYYPELEINWNERKDWYYGWPYYFGGKSDHKPNLWDFEAVKRSIETIP